MMSGEASREGRDQRVANAQSAMTALLADWPQADIEAHLARGYPAYWLSFEPEALARHARLIRQAERDHAPLSIDTRVDTARAVTEVTIYTPDHPGLFSRLAGALALAGADIVDARIATMTNGMALDVFAIQAAGGGGFDAPNKVAALAATVSKVLAGEVRLADELAKRKLSQASRGRVFRTPPRVIVDNTASRAHTMIEVNGHDRPGLLYEVTRCLTQLSLQIASAKISTYGNTAVDVFYVKDVFGLKVAHTSKLEQIREALLKVLQDPAADPAARPLRRRARAA
jgi:[protein-PII] uridylyltransferase